MTKRGRASAFAALVVAGCGAATTEATTIAPPSPSVAASAASASAAPDVASNDVAAPEAVASAAPTTEPPLPADRLSIEPAYAPGAFSWARDPADRKAQLEELSLWNAGGVAPGERWHAAPRVVIGEPVITSGKISTRDAMRALRRDQYWAVRKCYEPRLRDHPKLEGRTVLRLAVAADGTVRAATADKRARTPDDRKHGRAMADRELIDCLVRSFRGIRMPAPRSKTAAMLVSIDVWPGDAPLPVPEGPAARGSLELPRVDEAIVAARPVLAECFSRAGRGAWGRLALRLDVGADGSVDEVSEVASTFPDADVTACAAAALRAITLPPPRGGEARAIVAFRLSALR